MNACCLCVLEVAPIVPLWLSSRVFILSILRIAFCLSCPRCKRLPCQSPCMFSDYPSFTLQVSKSSDSAKDSTKTTMFTESSSLGVSSPAPTGSMSLYLPTGPAFPPLPRSPSPPPPPPPPPPLPEEEESTEKPDHRETREGSVDEEPGDDEAKDEKPTDAKEVDADSQVRSCPLSACLPFCHPVLYSPSYILLVPHVDLLACGVLV